MSLEPDNPEDAVIHYTFRLADGRSFQFPVDRNRVFSQDRDREPHADWTRLDFHQCSNCPLSRDDYRHCPAAVDLEPLASAFGDIASVAKVTVEVRAPERTYLKECDAQTGLRALLGLLMSTSACPILRRLRVLAATHLPFASLEETTFRFCGAYLIRQYFELKDGRTPDWEMTQLISFFQELQTLNKCFKNRLNAAVAEDSQLNALGTLFYIALGLQMSVEDNLQDIRHYFPPRA